MRIARETISSFSYSTDGINFTDLITVTKTSDDNTAQLAPLPAGVTGTVYIRVVDADRTVGQWKIKIP